MTPNRLVAATLVAIASLLIACGSGEDGGTTTVDARPVFASNYPLAYFSERLLGSSEQVYFPQIDGDPAFWTPGRDQIAHIQEAKVVVFNGATYEKWADKVALQMDRIVHTARPFEKAWIKIKHATTHSHGPEGDHSHAGTAFTTWLDLSQASQQLAALRDKLIAAKLAPEDELRKRHDALAAELADLDAQLTAMTKDGATIPLVASHPVYQYFARRYELNVRAVHWEPETDPGPEGWKALDKALEGHAARWMIWEGTPLPATVTKLAERGIRSVVFDPCGNRPDEGDFLSVMKRNLANLEPVFANR